jgi:hypothetical protein
VLAKINARKNFTTNVLHHHLTKPHIPSEPGELTFEIATGFFGTWDKYKSLKATFLRLFQL